MEIEKFNKLVLGNFDVSFNYKDIYYEISTYDKNGKIIISLAYENKWFTEFENVIELDNYILVDRKVSDIINNLKDDEIFY